VEDETALRFDRTADMDRYVRHAARLDPELIQQGMQPHTGHDPPDPDTQRAVLVVLAHRNHRSFEPWIADAGHGEEELACEKGS
jgi:hypothetical protein